MKNIFEIELFHREMKADICGPGGHFHFSVRRFLTLLMKIK